MKSDRGSRVFVLGFDGATFDLIDRLVHEGELPHFAQLLEGSVHGRLLSTVPPISAPAWTSFATGVNPGKHGIFGFTKKMPDSYRVRFVTGRDSRWPPVWRLLSDEGKRVVVLNVPMTYPPTAVNGVLISGLDAPSTTVPFTYPAEMKNEVLSVVPDYRIGMHLGGVLHSQRRRLQALDDIHRDIDNRLKLTLYLAHRCAWDFFVVKFNNPDLAQHHFWRYMDPHHPRFTPEARAEFKRAIEDVYKHLDRVLASIGGILGSDTVLVVLSDHGAGPRSGKSFRINEWLRRQGLLSTVPRKNGSFLRNAKREGAELLLPMLLRYVPPRVKDRIRAALPDTLSKMATHFKFPNLDWSVTYAYGAEINGIRFNLKGRDPAGIIEGTRELETLERRVIDGLLLERDPETGTRVFEAVFRREEIYHGEASDGAPDLILVPKDYQYAISNRLSRRAENGRGPVTHEPHWRGTSGRHRPEGILIIQSPDGGKRGERITGPCLMDIVPTILYRMGVPIPPDLDGRVLTEVFEADFLRENPICHADQGLGGTWQPQPGEIYSPEEAKNIERMLRGLDYID
jgi:predicted AlkP superfamily phosphohydrolase/phosphomutase